MGGTYSQVFVQAIFAVKGRENLLKREQAVEVFKYISGIITEKGQKSIIVNGMPDHVHCLFGLKPSMRISDMVRDMKSNSTRFINEMKWGGGRFAWQEGFGAFSYSRSQLDDVFKYILNQEYHHRKRTFEQEYKSFLKLFEISYDDKYLYNWLEVPDGYWG